MTQNAIEERGRQGIRFRVSWLIFKDAGSPREVLMLGDDKKTLPVFSSEEEARLYLHLSGLESGWRVGESGISDLVSVLADSCPNAERVALDPFPEIELPGLHDLVSLSREAFLGILAVERRDRRFLERRSA